MTKCKEVYLFFLQFAIILCIKHTFLLQTVIGHKKSLSLHMGREREIYLGRSRLQRKSEDQVGFL